MLVIYLLECTDAIAQFIRREYHHSQSTLITWSALAMRAIHLLITMMLDSHTIVADTAMNHVASLHIPHTAIANVLVSTITDDAMVVSKRHDALSLLEQVYTKGYGATSAPAVTSGVLQACTGLFVDQIVSLRVASLRTWGVLAHHVLSSSHNSTQRSFICGYDVERVLHRMWDIHSEVRIAATSVLGILFDVCKRNDISVIYGLEQDGLLLRARDYDHCNNNDVFVLMSKSLLQRCKDDTVGMRTEAVRSIASFIHASVIMRESDKTIMCSAIQHDLCNALVSLLSDADEQIRKETAHSLGQIAQKLILLSIDKCDVHNSTLNFALDVLMTQTSHSNENMRSEAATLLSAMFQQITINNNHDVGKRRQEVISQLRVLLNDSQLSTRHAAVNALCDMRCNDNESLLDQWIMMCAKEPDNALRCRVVQILGMNVAYTWYELY